MMQTESSCTYELKPVMFYDVYTENLNDVVPDPESQPTAPTAAVSPALLDDAPQNESSLSVPE
ncbi:hypothetical protein, partial [Salmonella sp. gx-f7]|uniref:hypothetical protein n=1 Tax=Salmonella sp. gx-f7 TaxID=2582606 RepID=UPI001F3114E8